MGVSAASEPVGPLLGLSPSSLKMGSIPDEVAHSDGMDPPTLPVPRAWARHWVAGETLGGAQQHFLGRHRAEGLPQLLPSPLPVSIIFAEKEAGELAIGQTAPSSWGRRAGLSSCIRSAPSPAGMVRSMWSPRGEAEGSVCLDPSLSPTHNGRHGGTASLNNETLFKFLLTRGTRGETFTGLSAPGRSLLLDALPKPRCFVPVCEDQTVDRDPETRLPLPRGAETT